MLKDDIKMREELIKSLKKQNEGDPIKLNLRGEVEIKAWKNGELFYHDGGNNTVTVWAKHTLIRLLTGDIFSSKGSDLLASPKVFTQPSSTAANHVSVLTPSSQKNEDGMLLSGGQYFWDYATYTDTHINKTSLGVDIGAIPTATPTGANVQLHSGASGRIYPFFPTKLLFGTGFEFPAGWNSLSVDWQNYLTTQGYSIGNFDTNISATENYYSNIVGAGATLTKARTVNDKVATQLADNEAIYEDDYGIDGAIKDCLARTSTVTDGTSVKITGGATDIIANGTQISPSFNGVGRPAFIYCKRGDEVWTDSAEVLVKTDDGLKDNRIVFTAVLPEQTLANAGAFYPYNGDIYQAASTGMMLKQVGLFSDARLTIADAIPSVGTGEAYYCMPGGIMMAKRKISPITKTKDVRISISWALYF